ncbi:SPOR domain-containing protein [Acidovorax sp. NCPPB 4044]|uniref:SPOR domain-containing protein n=1 Tax=Acidovorax sp. NCPPB 4044 TaxID=2940490 RepID=UPI002302676D|nr:SPOR domain-containing protein [Acidovorax sp. NCPPB 4044]MDA8521952.1 SPOR domain-containing protein [Acidovorax sp. NCPPB 4044]
MSATSAYAVTAATTPRRSDDSTMAVLYRAALGPMGTARYLSTFERFDVVGRAHPGWNWAAALCTLNWMVFRQLWSAALVYVAALEGLALLAVAVGQYTARWPLPVLAGLGLAVLLAATVIPGLYGNAFVHSETRKRITKALSASATLAQAQALLERQAPTPRRLAWIAAANALLALLIAAIVVALPRETASATAPAGAALPAARAPASSPAVPQASASDDAPAAPAPSVASAASAPGPAAAPQPPVSAAHTVAALPPTSSPPAARNASANLTRASAPAASSPGALASVAAAQPRTLETPAPATGASTSTRAPAAALPAASRASLPASRPVVVAPASATSQPAAAASAPARGVSTPAPAASVPRPPASAAASLPASAPARAARASAPTRATAAAAATTERTEAATRKLYINVGLFAEPANAQRAHGLLRGAGIPAATQPVTAADGRELLRVRAGPFTSASQANAAAARIRTLGLETSAAKRP